MPRSTSIPSVNDAPRLSTSSTRPSPKDRLSRSAFAYVPDSAFESSSGSSIIGMWPEPSPQASVEPGIAFAIASDSAGGTILS